MKITALIMAGGRGERFWPKSRKHLPKQFLSLTKDGKTMLQLTVERVLPLVPMEHIFVATGQNYRDLVHEQLPNILEENILCEPVGKNTAPCIGLGAVHIEKKFGEALMLVLASDHMIRDGVHFLEVLKEACIVAEKNKNLVTIGIRPNYPETGYGYIKLAQTECAQDSAKERDNGKDGRNGNGLDKTSIPLSSRTSAASPLGHVYSVECFTEKPDPVSAKQYVESGNYLWNSGMFVWKVSSILENIKNFLPGMYHDLKVAQKAVGTDQEQEILEQVFSGLSSVSIDYGVMERAKHIYTIPGDFGWDDVGSWLAVGRMKEADENGNVTEGNILAVDTKDCILQGGQKLIAIAGVQELVVVDTEDATLICSKDGTNQIKVILEQLRQRKQENYL